MTINATDVNKSVAFYARVFGNTVMKENHNARRYVKLGPNYVAIAPVGRAGKLLVAINIGLTLNFQIRDLKHALDRLGIQHREATDEGVLVTDPMAF